MLQVLGRELKRERVCVQLRVLTPSIKHSLDEKMAATTAKFLADEYDRLPISFNMIFICSLVESSCI